MSQEGERAEKETGRREEEQGDRAGGELLSMAICGGS